MNQMNFSQLSTIGKNYGANSRSKICTMQFQEEVKHKYKPFRKFIAQELAKNISGAEVQAQDFCLSIFIFESSKLQIGNRLF